MTWRPKPLSDTDVLRVLRATAGQSDMDDLCWDETEGGLVLWVNCSDRFAWGSADAESITSENVDLFVETMEECRSLFGGDAWHAPLLFCARVRAMRPQGAWYRQNISDPDEEDATWRRLFDAAGPPRAVGWGNPTSQVEIN